MERVSTQRRNFVLASAAVAAIAGAMANAGVTNDGGNPLSDPRTYKISASGATALGALTRGATTNSQNFPTGENNSLWRLGTDQLRIGRTLYTANVGAQQLLSWRTTPTSGANLALLTADRIEYQYHEVGSINGILETAKGGGLFLPSGFGNELDADTPSQSAPLWRQGWQQINATTYIIDGGGTQSASNPGGWAPGSQGRPRVGYTDVRSFQAFAADDLAGAPSPDRRPRDLAGTGQNENAQYGVGRKAYNVATGTFGTNFQALANRSVIAGEAGGDPGTSFLRNETLAIVPFAIAANPGTGLSGITEDDGRWLQGIGRLKNGANFNSTTREIGSGTRNQGANNLNLDASFGGGERDRRSLAAGNVNDVDVNGQPATIRPGDEMNPNKDLFGVDASLAASQQPKEHRVGPFMRFSDKSSGGSGVRPTVVNNRMALGVLSVGDVGDRGLQNLDGSIPANSRTDPMRVLKIKWDKESGESDTAGDDGYVQPTAFNVTNGRYQMWSAAQAVTVIGIDTNADGKADRRGTVSEDASNPNKLIWGDTDDQTQAPDGSALATPVGPAGVGVHRKFLNNIRQSVSNFPSTSVTPADGVIAAGFIPEQIMKVDKDFDGGKQTWSNSPAGFNQSLYDLLVVNDPPAGSANLKSRLNWIDPSVDPINSGTLGFVGDTNNASLGYRIFAADVSNSSTTPTKLIDLTPRNVLAGDMDGNGVRDLNDVEGLAQAYAASEILGNINGNGSVANVALGLSSDDLIVLTDFNGSGNIDPASTNAAPVYRAVDRNDVIFFLKGATVDTVNANPDTGYAGSTNAQVRREDGVRLGKLKKNEAIDRFNAAFLTAGGNTALTIEKADVDNNGVVDRNDARRINDLVGTAPFSLSLADLLTQYDIDPIYAELTDDNFIGHVDPDAAGPLKSDFQIARAELGALLLDGDTNFDGTVNLDDFTQLAASFGSGVDRWSLADFDFNGTVNLDDFTALAANFGLTAPSAAARSAVPEPATLGLIAFASMGLMARRRK